MNPKSGVIERLESFVLFVRDVRASRAWFERAFGVSAGQVNDHANLCVITLEGGTELVLQQMRAGEHPPSLGSAAAFPVLRVQDAAGFHHDLKAMGVQAGPFHDGAGRKSFSVRDLDDNRIDIVQLVRERGDAPEIARGGLSLEPSHKP
jgi:hypothetical protein